MTKQPSKRFWWHDAALSVCHEGTADDDTHRGLIRTLRGRGWSFRLDMSVHRSIRNDYHVGERGKLQVRCEHHPRLDSWTFYQSLDIENPNGGRYDFGRESKMPFLVYLQYRLTRSLLSEVLMSRRYVDTTEPVPRTVYDFVAYKRANWMGRGRQYSQAFDRSFHGTKSADGVEVQDGEVVYFVDTLTRRWNRGQAYYNTGNMFWVVANAKTHPRNLAGFQLHTRKSAVRQGRVVSAAESLAIRKRILKRAVESEDYERVAAVSRSLAGAA